MRRGRESLLSLLFRAQRTGEELVSTPVAAASRSPGCVTATVVVHGCYLVLAGWDRAEGCCYPRGSSLAAVALPHRH
nr:hypothetical protein Itr_chr10CG14230 [Ipomoea trifida]